MLYLSDAAVWFLEVLPTFIYPVFATLFWILMCQNRAYNDLTQPVFFTRTPCIDEYSTNHSDRNTPIFSPPACFTHRVVPLEKAENIKLLLSHKNRPVYRYYPTCNLFFLNITIK